MRLIVHAGTHKTGTTSLQRSLFEGREFYFSNGFIYPQLKQCKFSHNIFAHRIAISTSKELGCLKDEVMSCASENRTLIISSEEFSVRTMKTPHWFGFREGDYEDSRYKYLQRMKYIFDGFDEIDLFLCFRRHDEYAESLYATNLMSGLFNWSFHDFIFNCAPIFDFKKTESGLREFFPNVNVINFHEISGAVVKSMLRRMGLPVYQVLERRDKTTPDRRLIHWLYLSSLGSMDKEAQRLRGKWVRSKSARKLLDEAENFTLWSSVEDRMSFMASVRGPDSIAFPECSRGAFPAAEALVDTKVFDSAFSHWRASYKSGS